jgi:hypothetical protein
MQKKLKNNEIDDFEVTQRNQKSKDKGLSKSPMNRMIRPASLPGVGLYSSLPAINCWYRASCPLAMAGTAGGMGTMAAGADEALPPADDAAPPNSSFTLAGSPILATLGRSIDWHLVDSNGMDCGHETLGYPEIVIDDLGNRS